MKTLNSNQVIAPKQFGNPYFDAMSCPINVLPETFTVGVKFYDENGERKDGFTNHPITILTATLKTKDHYKQGNFVARKYTGCNMFSEKLTNAAYEATKNEAAKVCKVGKVFCWPKFMGLTFRNGDGIEILKPEY